MDLVLTPELILALSFAVRDMIGSLLQDLSAMTPEEREAWRTRQLIKKAEHDAWLEQHLRGGD